MKTEKLLSNHLNILPITALAALLLAGCQSAPEKSASKPAASVAPETPAAVAAPAVAPVAPAPDKISLPIRIKADATEGFTDRSGNQWLPDRGFADGETTERPDLAITNTMDPEIYRSERYSMTSFTQPLPNGKYTVKLHFCETYEGITGEGQRVFSFNVQGKDFKDFDIYKLAGGSQIAYVVTVPIEVTDGKLLITFTPNIENPQINGIEILLAP